MRNIQLVFHVFITIQVCLGGIARGVLLPFLPTEEGIHVSDRMSRRLGLDGTQPAATAARRPRNVVNLLALLWPQVVGPIDNGIIKEESFDEVPKTPLEHTLDQLRERSRLEVATRQHIRHMLNEGVEPARLGLHQLHLLHPDITTFLPHPQLHEINLHPDIHDTRPLEHHPALLLFNQNMVAPPPPYLFGAQQPFNADHHMLFQSVMPQTAFHQQIPIHPLIPQDAFNALLHRGFPPLPQRDSASPSAESNNNHATELKILGLPDVRKELTTNATAEPAVARGPQLVPTTEATRQESRSSPAGMYEEKREMGAGAGRSSLLPAPRDQSQQREESVFDAFAGSLPSFM